jgi:hypothetical protein
VTDLTEPGADGDTRDWETPGKTWVCPCGYGNRGLVCGNCGYPNPAGDSDG